MYTQFEALRTCVQFLKAYETDMDQFSPAVCKAAIDILNDRKSHDASLFAALEVLSYGVSLSFCESDSFVIVHSCSRQCEPAYHG